MILAEVDVMRLLVWALLLVGLPAAALWAKTRNRAVRDRLTRMEAKIDQLLEQRSAPK